MTLARSTVEFAAFLLATLAVTVASSALSAGLATLLRP